MAHPFQALMDRGFADAEVAGGIGLRVAGLEIRAQVRRLRPSQRPILNLNLTRRHVTLRRRPLIENST